MALSVGVSIGKACQDLANRVGSNSKSRLEYATFRIARSKLVPDFFPADVKKEESYDAFVKALTKVDYTKEEQEATEKALEANDALAFQKPSPSDSAPSSEQAEETQETQSSESETQSFPKIGICEVKKELEEQYSTHRSKIVFFSYAPMTLPVQKRATLPMSRNFIMDSIRHCDSQIEATELPDLVYEDVQKRVFS